MTSTHTHPLPILMILTAHARVKVQDADKATGLWAEELTTPYYALIDAGYRVVLASPAGKRPSFSQGSVKPNLGENLVSVQRFLQDTQASAALNAPLATADLVAADYAAVFLPGGHGTMWDTASDPDTARIVGDLFQAAKPVAAVCHGPAGLVGALRADGQSILKDKKVNGFTAAEEQAAGWTGIVPFELEGKMRSLGGVFESGAMWGAYAVRDGNLITGQNPASSELVAEHLLAALAALAAVGATAA